jgi:cardiolipin synthase (CMP-forming)
LRNKQLYTIPNILSFYRLLTFPLILFFAATKQEQLFVILLVINLVTDVLDGWIARAFKMETEFGARLDSIADIGTYILAFSGIIIFKRAEFAPHLPSFLTYIFLFAATQVFSLIKFGRFSSFHLYSWKVGGYIQGLFLIVLFTLGFHTLFYHFMIIWAILSALEHLVVQAIIPEMRSNARGLYWVLKNRKP